MHGMRSMLQDALRGRAVGAARDGPEQRKLPHPQPFWQASSTSSRLACSDETALTAVAAAQLIAALRPPHIICTRITVAAGQILQGNPFVKPSEAKAVLSCHRHERALRALRDVGYAAQNHVLLMPKGIYPSVNPTGMTSSRRGHLRGALVISRRLPFVPL